MNDVNKNLGHATAYGYAKSKGYTGTEDEFAALMADYAEVGERAEAAATAAAASATAASGSASDSAASATAAEGFAGNASTAAGNASQAAQNASQSATAASGSATSAAGSATAAAGSATTAGNKATEAAQSATAAAGSATTAGTSATAAQTAQTAAETAQTAAETAQAAAEAAAQTLVIDPTLTQPNQAAEAKATGDAISLVKSHLSGRTWNLITPLNGTATVNNVKFKTDEFGYMSISGTANNSGGRLAHVSSLFTLAAGDYTLQVNEAVSQNLLFMVEANGTNTILATVSKATKTAYFTLSESTSVYIGANVTSGVMYDVTGLVLQVKSGDADDVLPYLTANDLILRKRNTVLEADLCGVTGNLISLVDSANINGVQFINNGANGFSFLGTATVYGGRSKRLTKVVELPAGTYYFAVFSDSAIPEVFLQNVNENAVIATVKYPNEFYTVTLENPTSVFVGINTTNQSTYNIFGAYFVLSSKIMAFVPQVTAVDFVARQNLSIIDDIKASSLYTLKDYFPFVVGSYDSNNDNVTYNTRYRLISQAKYTTKEDIHVYMPSGYRFGIVFYDGNNRTDTGWITGDYIIPTNSTFLLQLAKSPDVTTDSIINVKDSDLYQNLTFEAWAEEPETTPYDSVLPISTEQLSVANPWSQGACLVGRKLVGFNASSDDHSTNGTARIYDADNNLTQIGSFAHNTGHASTADYCKRTDTMSVANGTYASGVVPTIYLVKNASAKIAAASNILITDPDVIAFDVSNLTGQGVGACFGETDQFMYVLTVENASQYDQYPTKYIYKLLMGKGSNDMTSLFASDNFGTFISGCGDNEYNGTAHLVASYSLEVYGELQGLKYRNGFLYMSCDSSKLTNVKTPYLAKMKLTADAAELVDFYHIPNYSNTGDLLSSESEGFVFDGAVGYVTVFPSGNPSRTLRFNAII